MKILHVNKFLFQFGGSESYMFGLAKAQQAKGYQVEFWGMQDERNEVEDTYSCFAENVDYHNSHFIKMIWKSFSTIYSIANKRRIRKVLDEFKPDVVHLHNYNFQLTPSILPELKKRRIKVIHTIHDAHLVCPWHRLYRYKEGVQCTKCVKGSFFNVIRHRCIHDNFGKSLIGYLEAVFYHSRNYYARFIDVFISPSDWLADFVSNKVPGEIKVIRNFTNRNFENSDDRGAKDYLLFFGRISKEKGIARLTKKLKSSNIHLKIVGSGDDVDNLETSDRIEYLGPKYDQELQQLIRGAKFTIHPSAWLENSPMTIYESFALGIPVIGPKHSGFLELVEDGQTGYLLDFDSPTLANDLEEIFERNDDFSSNCKSYFESELSMNVNFPKVLNEYQD